ICILECEGQAVPRATWELCAATARTAPRPRRPPSEPWPGSAPIPVPVPVPVRLSRPQRRRLAADPAEPEDVSRRPTAAMAAAKGVQKRYGGFIGVRKSARKWNNQKRFSEFLRQYLGMAPRSSEYGTGERQRM
ncbi:prepronociceptin, partial [Malurus melanocephalus]|uniref:prepronociceptin n=1 Tax=Malurus melanocephalus TaxID=175006 RepID=UPI002549159E